MQIEDTREVPRVDLAQKEPRFLDGKSLSSLCSLSSTFERGNMHTGEHKRSN